MNALFSFAADLMKSTSTTADSPLLCGLESGCEEKVEQEAQTGKPKCVKLRNWGYPKNYYHSQSPVSIKSPRIFQLLALLHRCCGSRSPGGSSTLLAAHSTWSHGRFLSVFAPVSHLWTESGKRKGLVFVPLWSGSLWVHVGQREARTTEPEKKRLFKPVR